MNLINLILVSILYSFSCNQPIEINLLRKSLINAGEGDCKLIEKANAILINNDNKNFNILAYKGAFIAMKAQCVSNPFKKMEYFNTGKNFIEEAIASDKNNIDVRFVRFTLQKNIPSFLNYNNRDNDFEVLYSFVVKSSIDQFPAYFKQAIIGALLNYEKLNKTQLNELNKRKNN